MVCSSLLFLFSFSFFSLLSLHMIVGDAEADRDRYDDNVKPYKDVFWPAYETTHVSSFGSLHLASHRYKER